MLHKIINHILRPRHYWRTVGFDELSELYVSQLLRSLSLSLVGVFIPIYMYKLGFTFAQIALFHVIWFIPRWFFDLVSGHIIGRIGPKHAMLIGNLFHAVYLVLIMTLNLDSWYVYCIALVGSFSYSIYILAHDTDFSKVKHKKHGGKELGYVVIMQRIGGVIGPLVGGILANYFNPRYTLGLAILVLIVSTFPLFFTKEAVATRQKITFKGMQWRGHIWDFVSVVPLNLENIVSISIWPLFMALFVLGDDTYAKLGVIIAISTLSSLVLSRAIGGVIDDRKGRQLLRLGAISNAFLHIFRGFATTPVQALAVNVINEPITAAYRMPYLKGAFDAADQLPGYRIAYLTLLSMVEAVGRLIFWVIVYTLTFVVETKSLMFYLFFFGGLCSFGIMLERFKALNVRRGLLR